MSNNKPALRPNTATDIVNENEYNIEIKNYYSKHNENSKKFEWSSERIQNVFKLLEEYKKIKSEGGRLSNKHYHHARKYDVEYIGKQKVLVAKRKDNAGPVLQIISTEEYYQKILEAHIATGHGRRDKTVFALKDKYVVPIFAVTILINMCKTCRSKKSLPKTEIVVKPLVSEDFKRRGQIDLIDFQASPDKEYKWLLLYQDHLTNFCFLRPLKSKEAKEVALEILKIFLEVGCPYILQSDYGRDFTASVLKEVSSLWPACKIVNGRLRCPQDNESKECLNLEIKSLVEAWMTKNKSTNWSIGCYFVQFQKNSSYNSTIAQTPYKALFGVHPKLGLSSTFLPKKDTSKLENEEDLENLFEEINYSYENSTEKNHDEEEQEIITKIKQEETTTDKMETNRENSPVMDFSIHKANIKQEKPSLDYISSIKSENQWQEYGTIDKLEIASTPYYVDNIGVKIEAKEYFVCNVCNKESFGDHICIKYEKIADDENDSNILESNFEQEKTQSALNLKRVSDKKISFLSKKIKDNSSPLCNLDR